MKRALLLVFLLFTTFVFSQGKVLWQKESPANRSMVKSSRSHLPTKHTYSLDLEGIKAILQQAPMRGEFTGLSKVILAFPNHEGVMESYRIMEAPVMHSELMAKYPGIKSYAGQGVEDPAARIRFSVSPLGLQSMRLSGNSEATFIEPYTNDLTQYTVYKRSDKAPAYDAFECEVKAAASKKISGDSSVFKNADDSILRTYRLAISATGEYTQYHGGTKALALAAMNTTMTRVNGIYETDFNITMVLIANTDDVIYTNPSTDPYGSTTSGYNSELQSTLTSVIGEANYDIGHLFANLQNNGNAGCIGCVCVDGQKGSGWTSHTVPEGDPFDVDYVAHEMGHQFGGNHTWTFNGNENTAVEAQLEPGSGSTIMGYAGITGATDVQSNSDPYFHAVSIQQITDYIKTTSCQTNTSTGNSVPVVNAGPNYTIPKGTPFVLDGTATDTDTGDVLTYCWEQMDHNNASTTYPSTTNATGVAFRSYLPTTDTHRYFPRLATIKTGATSWQWEAIPDVARTLSFRLTVRDNAPGGGTNNSDDVSLTVNGTAGPFVVSAPNTNVIWNAGTTQTVTWDVAGTTGNGVNATNVDIFLSTDGGDTYPISLASGVPNDGSQDIIVPSVESEACRVMVKGSNNIFFDISDSDFIVGDCSESVPTGFVASSVGPTSVTLTWNDIFLADYDLRYREVGSGTWITTSTNDNTIDLTALSPETEYETQVRSRCPDNSTSTYSSIITFITTAIPPCLGIQITTYPYLETFDLGIGDWSQGTGDDGDWIIDANGTPSQNTGPTDDITGGGNYLFLESSSNGSPGEVGSNATVYFDSPCFDLTSLTKAFLTFNYHMFGATMGSLSLDLSNDNGNSWTSIFSIGGDQGNSWQSTTIDLSSYAGGPVKLRFTGITGSSFTSDIAIDHISISEEPTYCDSNGDNTSGEYINRVQLGTIDNNNSGAGTTSTGYSDFTSLSTDLNGGQSYTITITPTWPGSVNNEGYSVWIDYNKNGSFDDPGEQVFTQSPTQTSPISGGFTVPLNVEYGTTRMRVSLQNSNIPFSCGNFSLGEVEDYTINLVYDGLLFSYNNWSPNAPSSSTGVDDALVLNGTYNISSNITLNNLNVISGASVQIAEGNTLELNGNLSNEGDITLNSISNSYSSLIVYGTATGNVNYKRHVNNNAGGNDLISAPVTGQIFTDFISNNSNIMANGTNTLYLFGPFDKTTGTYVLYSNTESSALTPGTGYRAASINNDTFTFSGIVNTGNVNVNIFDSGPLYAKWNLIGNTYPSYVSLSDFLSSNNSQFDAQNAGLYGYDGSASDGWTIWNQAFSDANPGSIITPGQGFFVASKPGGGIISFTPSMMTTGTDDDFIVGRSSSTTNEISHLKLKMETTGQQYVTDLYFTDNASQGLDPGYDAGVYGGSAPVFAIYSHLVAENYGVDMAIQSVSNTDLNNNIIIPIGINTNQGQQLTISIDSSTLDPSIDVYFEDNVDNQVVLLNTNDYVFTPSTQLSGSGRFFIRFETGTLSNPDNEIGQLQIFNTSDPEVLHVKGLLTEKAQLTMYDIQGREVINQELSANVNWQQIDISHLKIGIYIVEIKNNNYSLTKKVVTK